jgi:hypothetical protein
LEKTYQAQPAKPVNEWGESREKMKGKDGKGKGNGNGNGKMNGKW